MGALKLGSIIMKSPFPVQSLFFAPMEGITDDTYRRVILKNFPEWDYMACDFLRVPAAGLYPKPHIIEHYGHFAYENPVARKKTLFQILTSEKAFTQETVTSIKELGFEWLDLNLGCPSKTVTAHKGGSFLLTDLPLLKKIVSTIRAHFPHTFTCKIRVGYHDDKSLEDIIKLLQDEGAQAITVHARTRDDLYKGIANWDYITRAVKVATVPIVGNGDIWKPTDVKKIFEQTGCHSVMVARGALKSPWLAYQIKNNKFELTTTELLRLIENYFKSFLQVMSEENNPEEKILKRFKSVSRYIFDDLPDAENVKRQFMRGQSLTECQDVFRNVTTKNENSQLAN